MRQYRNTRRVAADPYEADAETSRSRSRARSESVKPTAAAAATVDSGDAPGQITFEVIKAKPKAKSRGRSRDPRVMAAEIGLDTATKRRGRPPLRAPIPSVVM